MTIARRSCIAFAVTVFLFAAKKDTRPPLPFLGETIEVSIVNVDVVVTDRAGNRIRGLTRADFEIFENGKLQPVSHFAEYRGTEGGTAGVEAGAYEAPPPQRRTLVIFIEQFRLGNFKVDPFIASIKDLVRKTIRKGDAVSLIWYDRRGATVRVPRTDDVAAVERALDDIRRECIGPYWDATGMVAGEVASTREFESTAAAMAARQGMQRSVSSPSALAASAARIHALEARVQMNRRIATINAIIEGMAGVEGKKMLLLAAHRLGEYTGAEFFYAGGLESVPIEDRALLDNKDRVRQIIANANSAGVTVYPMYPPGVDERTPDPDAPDIGSQVMSNEMAMLTEIADKTGGLSTWGAVAIAKLMPRVVDDVSDYYSLAYRATTHREDDTRSVQVKTTDRSLRVRARRQFVDRSDDTRMRDRIIAAVHSQWSESPLPITATLGQRVNKRGKQTLPLKIRVPIGHLTLLPQKGKHQGAFSVYLITGGKLGETSDVTRQTQPFEIPLKDLERARAGNFTYDFEMVINDRAERMTIGVLDEVSKSYGVLTLPIK